MKITKLTEVKSRLGSTIFKVFKWSLIIWLISLVLVFILPLILGVSLFTVSNPDTNIFSHIMAIDSLLVLLALTINTISGWVAWITGIVIIYRAFYVKNRI